MTKNTIKIMDNNEAQVSKTFAKNARIYGTEEYRIWREFKAENPEFVMVVKTIKKNPDKKTYKNLTYKNMRDFIKENDNKKKELEKEFDKQIRMSKIQSNPYRAVLAWFLQKFENYDASIIKDFPNLRISVQSGREQTIPRYNKRLTYANMETYIKCHENSEVILSRFETVKEMSKTMKSPYKYVCDWFLSQFPDFHKIPKFEGEIETPKLKIAPVKNVNIASSF